MPARTESSAPPRETRSRACSTPPTAETAPHPPERTRMSRSFSSAARAVFNRRTAGLAAAAAIAVAALASGNAFAGPKPPPATVLHYTLHFSPLTVIDVGAKGNSLGDEIVSHDVIFSTSGKRVGYDAQTCMITSLRPPQLGCSLVFALPGGTITGQYIGAPPPRKLAAITGGTGRYVGAKGTIEVVESGHDISDKNTLTFTLIP